MSIFPSVKLFTSFGMKVVEICHADMIFECMEELAVGIALSNRTE